MKQVAEGNNPHVVNMIGCVTLQEPVCLVTEFVKYGDLLTYLSTVRRMVRVHVCVCMRVCLHDVCMCVFMCVLCMFAYGWMCMHM